MHETVYYKSHTGYIVQSSKAIMHYFIYCIDGGKQRGHTYMALLLPLLGLEHNIHTINRLG